MTLKPTNQQSYIQEIKMYQLEWANFEDGQKGTLFGSADNLYLFYHFYLSHRKWDVLVLRFLGNPTYEVPKNGNVVSWWKEPLTKE